MTLETCRTPASLRALLRGIIDYAGLFPPARLDMSTTVENYARYLEEPDAWMLARIIVPVARLEEFIEHARPHLPARETVEPWQISALTAPAGDAGLEDDLERIKFFNKTHRDPRAGLAQIGAIELKATTPAAIDEALDRIPDEVFPFFELPVDRDPRGLIAAIAGSDGGAKVRTGGVTATDGGGPRPPRDSPNPPDAPDAPDAPQTPAPADLARFIAGCAAAHVPFKATAGLHCPLRHKSPSGVEEFGFLNVFVAGLLARSCVTDDLVAVLSETRPEGFLFDAETLRYRDHAIGLEEIERRRATFATSFGSCSFDEPREHLRAMALL